MTNVILCPNCHGSKLVSTPPMIAGRSRHSYDSSGTETYPCPVCDGKGWVDSDADSDVAAMKTIVLSAFETSENLMDECTKRGNKIKAIEALVGEKDLRIADLDAQRDIVRKTRNKHEDELLTYIDELNDNITEFRKSRIIDMKTRDDIYRQVISKREDELMMMIEERDEQITILKSKNRAAANNLMLLDVILKHVNPAIRLGRWRTTVGSGDFMRDVCNDVVAFRSKHDECKECGIPLGYEYGDARMNGMCVYCFANHKEIV